MMMKSSASSISAICSLDSKARMAGVPIRDWLRSTDRLSGKKTLLLGNGISHNNLATKDCSATYEQDVITTKFAEDCTMSKAIEAPYGEVHVSTKHIEPIVRVMNSLRLGENRRSCGNQTGVKKKSKITKRGVEDWEHLVQEKKRVKEIKNIEEINDNEIQIYRAAMACPVSEKPGVKLEKDLKVTVPRSNSEIAKKEARKRESKGRKLKKKTLNWLKRGLRMCICSKSSR